MTDTLIAYHGDTKLKKKIMAQIRAHRKADEIVQGAYYNPNRKNGTVRVCAVGCVLHDPNGGHVAYETEFGIPVQLAYLEDSIFESLPLDVAKEWPARFMGAIRPGANLSRVWPEFAIWLMIDPEWGSVNVAEAEDIKEACRKVADGYARLETITGSEVRAINQAAWSAVTARAAWSARDSWSAYGAVNALVDVRHHRRTWTEQGAFVAASADKLIELLEACK
jgi:hypothetical protein